MTDKEFDALMASLTERQREVLGLIAMNQDGGHHPKTLAALAAKGLIEEYKENLGGRFPLIVNRYEMPIAMHIRWCEWCSRNVGDEDEESEESNLTRGYDAGNMRGSTKETK